MALLHAHILFSVCTIVYRFIHWNSSVAIHISSILVLENVKIRLVQRTGAKKLLRINFRLDLSSLFYANVI